ncbi:magnesium transporter MRS2-i-like protein [Trifolium pratense]|uniref:Magnesium transporter MRS2-i-like protein n=1 Tax=Trifolium pratense TaxID=57577 RepID=A0A2K3LBP5_TRIPR|nr:magnesium transporter MRS2-i-like protein [Trifolium pratense]
MDISTNRAAFTAYTSVVDDEDQVYLGDSRTATVNGIRKVFLKLTFEKTLALSSCYLLQVRDELAQLLDDDDDMAVLYLSRKAGSTSPVSGGSGAANWFSASPTIGSKISRASIVTGRFNENDVEEIEMLLEAYFMQIDETLNKL